MILASYNNFTNNTQRDAIIIAVCNSATSIFAGIVIFAILGFISKQQDRDIEDVVEGGIALAFITIPTAVLEMVAPQLWSSLFFFMLINLALSSICGGVQSWVAFIMDEWPKTAKYRYLVVIASCATYFSIALSMCTGGGIHLFTVFDSKCSDSLVWLSFFMVVVTSWIYGLGNFFDNLEEMTVVIPGWLRWVWRILLWVITPALCLLISVIALIPSNRDDLSYGDYIYPEVSRQFHSEKF